MRSFFDFLSREPIAVTEFVKNVVILLVIFNRITITEAQFGTLMLAIGSFLALISRAMSTPNVTVEAAIEKAANGKTTKRK